MRGRGRVGYPGANSVREVVRPCASRLRPSSSSCRYEVTKAEYAEFLNADPNGLPNRVYAGADPGNTVGEPYATDPVPEPATAVLLALGLIGVAVRPPRYR